MQTLIAGFTLAATISLAAAASAESRSVDRGPIARSVLEVCMSSPMGANMASPEVGCACAVGVMSARMDDRQFYIIGRIAPVYFDEEALAQLDLVSEGFTEAELMEVSDIIENAMSVSDDTCWPLRR